MEAGSCRMGDRVRVLSAKFPGTWMVRQVHATTIELVQDGGEHGTIVLTTYPAMIVSASGAARSQHSADP